MKALRGGRAVAFTLLHAILVGAQSANGTDGTNVPFQSSPPFPVPGNSSGVITDSVSSTVLFSTETGGTNVPPQSSPPFHIPANNSGAVTDSASSTVFLGSETTISTGTVTETLSSSDTNTPLPETSTGSFLLSDSSLTATYTPSSSGLSPTATDSSSGTSSFPTNMLSSGEQSATWSASATFSAGGSTSMLVSTIRSITDRPPSTSSATSPPGTIEASSASHGIILPPGITLPPNPSTTLSSIGTEVQSSASDLSIVIAGIFPLIQSWIDHPDAADITGVINGLDRALPKATHLLGKLPIPTNGVEPCKSGRRRRSEPEPVAIQISDKRSLIGNLFKTAFSLVTCVIDTANKVKDGIAKGTTDAVETVKNLQEVLKPMVDALNEVDPNEDGKPSVSVSASEASTSTQSRSSSSSSCTLQTVSNCNVGCTAVATTTLGGPSKRAENEACATVCKTFITSCGATGVTSVSTVTSTTTTYQLCGPDCAGCNDDDSNLPTDVPDLSAYSKAPNGVLYSPAPTVTALDTDNPAVEARGLIPKETGSPSNQSLKRWLPNPRDPTFATGTVWEWLKSMIILSPNKLRHGKSPITTTGFTFPLGNTPNSWHLINLYGCTSVIVISRKRMFMTHIWERPTIVSPENMQTDVLDTLRNGAPGVSQGLTTFTGPGGDFENIPANKVRAFIITPYRRANLPANPTLDDILYPSQVGQIRDLLVGLLGRRDIITIPYIPMFPDEELRFPFGKVLIQYDPGYVWLREDGGCSTQVAAIELWFEDHPIHRYRDTWNAFPHQFWPAVLQPRRSILGDGKTIRLLRGNEVTRADEEEWKEFESIMKREGGGSCPLPSTVASASSSSPPSSSSQNPTTLQTSFVSVSSGGETAPSKQPPSLTEEPPASTNEQLSEIPTPASEQPPSSTEEPPASTKEQISEISTPASDPTPTPNPTPNRAVSIIMTHIHYFQQTYNTWTFFETSFGSQADGCGTPVLDDKDTRWFDQNAINYPPWPHGTFTMTLFGEDNCQYLNDGTGADILHCPSMGEGNNVGCKEDAEKSQVSAITQCSYNSNASWSYHRAVSCEYYKR